MDSTEYDSNRRTDARTDTHGASDDVRAAAQSVKSSAADMLDDAKQGAQSKLNAQKDVAADGIDSVADALRNAANGSDKSGQRTGNDAIASLAGSAADGLERLSGTLRNKDVGAMVRDAESFARNQPMAFFGLALVTGFLAVRFMKAGDSPPDSNSSANSYRAASASRTGGRNTFQEDAWTPQ